MTLPAKLLFRFVTFDRTFERVVLTPSREQGGNNYSILVIR